MNVLLINKQVLHVKNATSASIQGPELILQCDKEDGALARDEMTIRLEHVVCYWWDDAEVEIA